MKNFGKLTFTPETVSNGASGEVQIYVLRDQNGVEWHDLFKQFPHSWYIAVMDDGRIISMESDPEQSQIAECTLWGIDSNFGFTRGTGGTVYGKIWDGTKIAPRPLLPRNSPLSPDQFYGLLDSLGKLDQFETAIEQVMPVAKKLTCRNQFRNSQLFTWDMILVTMVAPLIWGADWQTILTPAWIASGQA